ncbi:MAG: 4Fe-4S dicluster domain-containing protein [Candidatus Bipolaricaulota bacterium]
MADQIRLSKATLSAEFARRVEELSGQSPYRCYQCGKCSAGCPFTESMDLLPSQVLRLVQIGDERVLEASAPWSCASCLACEVRCPRGVDIAKVMEAVRLLALRKGKTRLSMEGVAAERLPQIALVGISRKMTP